MSLMYTFTFFYIFFIFIKTNYNDLWYTILDIISQGYQVDLSWCSWSLLNVYAWFGEAEHVMFFKLVEYLRLIWGSEARDVLEVGVLEESLYLQRSFNLRGWSTSGVRESALGRILSRSSGVKNFQPLQMRIILLFIEFISGLYGLKPGWSMDQTHGLNHMDLCYI